MILEIDDTTTIAALQDKFATFFPFLKIVFYEHPHHWYEGSAKKTELPPDTVIGDIRKLHHEGDYELHSWFRTGEMEQTFRKKFNLNVQVFRLHGTDWVQTAGTDKLSLGEQNEIAQKATLDSRPMADSVRANESLM